MQCAPKQCHRGHDHVKDREDSTAGFEQVFLVYIDQKLLKLGEENVSLPEDYKWDLLGLIIFKKQSNICAVLLGDTV